MQNTLFFGDNLNILRDHIHDASVDLVYLDPPFNSSRSYNVLFKDETGTQPPAQIRAFEDTWRWSNAADIFFDTIADLNTPDRIRRVLETLHALLGTSEMMAYLAMMTPRLMELHRVLKPTGILYLHCDPTASHYLKIILDTIFDPRNYRNEIVWKRSSAHSDTRQGMKWCGRIHDILLFYSKSADYTWNPQYMAYTPDYLANEYRHLTPEGRHYKETDVTAAKPGGDTAYDWPVKRERGLGQRWVADIDAEYRTPRDDWEYRPVRPYNGRFWAYSKANMVEFARTGHLIHRETGMPRLIQYADEMPGVTLQQVSLSKMYGMT